MMMSCAMNIQLNSDSHWGELQRMTTIANQDKCTNSGRVAEGNGYPWEVPPVRHAIVRQAGERRL